MDRLPWSPFHTRLVIALGVTWVLDGLEITLASLTASRSAPPPRCTGPQRHSAIVGSIQQNTVWQDS